jgi:tetratricopeptide (TPR) repeat protein
LRAACALARNDLAQAGALLDGFEQDSDPGIAARAALVRVYLHMASGEWDQARSAAERALAPAMEAGSAKVMLDALEAIAQTELAGGEIGKARVAIEAFIRALRAFKDPTALRRLVRLADAADAIYPEEVIPLLDAALAIADGDGDRKAAVGLRMMRALVAHRLGNKAEVRTALAQMLARVHAEDPVRLRAGVDAVSAILLAEDLLVSPDPSNEETIVNALEGASEQLRAIAPQIAAMAGMRLGAMRQRTGQLSLARTAYRQAETDARAANDLDQAVEAALKDLEVEIEAEKPSEAVLDKLRSIAGAARTAGQVSREAAARLILARGLLGRGAREAALAELTRAQECFAACADDDGEAAATRCLAAAKHDSVTTS